MSTDEPTAPSNRSSKPSVTVLVGMVGSGKTTLAREIAQNDPGTVYISNDEIVNLLHGGDYTAYEPALRPLYKQVEQHMVAAALAQGCNVVIDRTNLTRQQRRRFIALAETFGAKSIVALVMPCPPNEDLLENRMKEPRGYSREHWANVIAQHHQQAEAVTIEEGFTDIIDHSGSVMA